jgi:hypothetical protein
MVCNYIMMRQCQKIVVLTSEQVHSLICLKDLQISHNDDLVGDLWVELGDHLNGSHITILSDCLEFLRCIQET